MEALWAHLEESFFLANESSPDCNLQTPLGSRTLIFRSNGALVSKLVSYHMSDPRKQWTGLFGTAKLQWGINAATSLCQLSFWLLKGFCSNRKLSEVAKLSSVCGFILGASFIFLSRILSNVPLILYWQEGWVPLRDCFVLFGFWAFHPLCYFLGSVL